MSRRSRSRATSASKRLPTVAQNASLLVKERRFIFWGLVSPIPPNIGVSGRDFRAAYLYIDLLRRPSQLYEYMRGLLP